MKEAKEKKDSLAESYKEQQKLNQKLNKEFLKMAKEGKVEKIRQLLDAGANINYQKPIRLQTHPRCIRSSQSPTALLYAVKKDQKNLVAMLVDRGANCNIAGGIEFMRGLELRGEFFTPLRCAIHYHSDREMVRLLLKGGADIYEKRDLLELAYEHKADNVLECILEKLRQDRVSEAEYHDQSFRVQKSAYFQKQSEQTAAPGLKSLLSGPTPAFFQPSPESDSEKKVISTDSTDTLMAERVIEYLKKDDKLWQQLQKQPEILNQVQMSIIQHRNTIEHKM